MTHLSYPDSWVLGWVRFNRKSGSILLDNQHERAIADMKMTESECDDLSHVLLEEMNKSFITPFDREDIFTITNQLDDIADYIEDTASKLQIYGVESIRDDAKELGNLIDDATSEVARLFIVLPESRKNRDAMENIIEINRLENLGDAVFRRALGKLFGKRRDTLYLSVGLRAR